MFFEFNSKMGITVPASQKFCCLMAKAYAVHLSLCLQFSRDAVKSWFLLDRISLLLKCTVPDIIQNLLNDSVLSL